MKKVVKGSAVVPPTTDQTYHVPNARCLGITICFFLSIPWIALIVLGILTVTGVDVRMQWWLFGFAGANIGPMYQWIFYNTNKIVLHTDRTVSHINLLGLPVSTQNHIPLEKFKKITINFNRVTYIKSQSYFEECQANCKCCAGWVSKKEVYRINEPIDFAADHGMVMKTDKLGESVTELLGV